jgi:hypothetical protein
VAGEQVVGIADYTHCPWVVATAVIDVSPDRGEP